MSRTRKAAPLTRRRGRTEREIVRDLLVARGIEGAEIERILAGDLAAVDRLLAAVLPPAVWRRVEDLGR